MEYRQNRHAALPVPSHDECARQDFVASLRQFSGMTLGAGNYGVYKAQIEPGFIQAHGRTPADAAEVRPLMEANAYFQFWSATQRSSQEMMWDSVIDTVERQLPRLATGAASPGAIGTLALDPTLELPRYHTAYDIHLQPGGYHSEQVPGDVAAGAIYDLGVPLYALGMMGRENNSTGDTLVNGFTKLWPERSPALVLDLGCAIGNSTASWKRAFPAAEVHGVDVAAPCLRYGHARANALGLDLNLSQQNAESLNFPDDHFDVVASALLFHETSRPAVERIFREIRRVLKPGGVMIHFDGFKVGESEPILDYLGLWEVYNNNEKFLLGLKAIDVIALNRELGFSDVRFEPCPYITDLPPRGADGAKGYMAAGFGTIPLLVAEK